MDIKVLFTGLNWVVYGIFWKDIRFKWKWINNEIHIVMLFDVFKVSYEEPPNPLFCEFIKG
jgi:hypothetical protein